MKLTIQKDLLIAAALSVAGALARIPYLGLIPVFDDAVLHTVYSLSIQPGEFMPLKGLDPYSGPLFAYVLAIWLKVFGASPYTPLMLMIVMGALTVGLAYLLARAMGLSWAWAMLVGLLMAANPHHILVNSHIAGASYTVPLFSTAFLAALAFAVKRGSGPWLVTSGVLLALAMQGNPVPILMAPGLAIWFLAQPASALQKEAVGHQSKSNIGLKTPWPYLAVLAFALAYSPVIIYNVRTGLAGVSVATNRSYIWEPNPSLPTCVRNLGRLALQLCQQISGVLVEHNETYRTLVGLPLLFSAWAMGGLIYTARPGKPMGMSALAVGSQMLIMPWLSGLYGEIGVTRFTNQLTPLIFVAMVALARDGITTIAALPGRKRPGYETMPGEPGSAGFIRRCLVDRTSMSGRALPAIYLLLVALSLWPLVQLFQYYNGATALDKTNARYYAFFGEFQRQWRGEQVFLTDTLGQFNPTEYFMAVYHVPYQLMPVGRIIERLALKQETGPVTLVLDKEDVPIVKGQAELVEWNSPTIQEIRHKQNYGVYTIPDAQQVRKPGFVITTSDLPATMRAAQANFADRLGVVGYQVKPDKAAAGQGLIVNVYWKAINIVPDDYMGFVHLVNLNGQLATQDDHELGRGLYRADFWQPDEIIRERYLLNVPKGLPKGDYNLQAGVYTFPSLKRLPVRSASTATQDDMITLGVVQVGP